MALTDDQKAILRLLAQRGEAGYADLSALMGIPAEEVHARARGAAEQLEAEGIPAPAIPPPPDGRSGRVSSSAGSSPKRPPQEDDAPAATERSRRALPRGRPKPSLGRELKLLEGRGLWAILAGVAIVVLFLVILLVSGGGGRGGSSTSTTVGGSTPTVAESKKQVTEAVLNPVDGSEATGAALFGRVKNTLALQVAVEGLEPSVSGESYTVWLAASPQKMLPLATTHVGKDGRINAQVEVPTEILAYLADETFSQIAVTRTDESRLQLSLRQATKEKKAPDYTGTEVLRGTVTGPIVGAAKKE